MYPHLLSQIVRGLWFIRPEDAMAGMVVVNKLLNDNDHLGDKLLSERKPLMGDDGSESSFNSLPKGSTFVASISGSLVKYGTWCSYGTEEIAEVIREAAAHENITSILLKIDSGGGACNAIDPITSAIRYAQQQGKPVLALCDMCASAAYFIAAQCDKIVASNSLSAEFGSIGVMASFVDVKPYYEKEGYKFHDVYSSHSANKNEAFRLALEGNYDKIKAEELDPLALSFQKHVKERRKNLKCDTEGIISGKMFFAEDAVANGLCDAIATEQEALAMLKALENDYAISDYINSKN
ncbi:MAG: S49 family peptidase [Marinifilaceae bacterium]